MIMMQTISEHKAAVIGFITGAVSFLTDLSGFFETYDVLLSGLVKVSSLILTVTSFYFLVKNKGKKNG